MLRLPLVLCMACVAYKDTAGLREREAEKEGGWAPASPNSHSLAWGYPSLW